MVDRSRAERIAGSALLGVGLFLAVTGCAGEALNTDRAAETTTSSAEETSSSPTETSASETTATETTAVDDSDGPLDPEDEGRKLTLTDFHMPTSAWDERALRPRRPEGRAGHRGDGAATAAPTARQELELRLGNNFEELTFSVAQGNDSRDSDQHLSVEVLANDGQE